MTNKQEQTQYPMRLSIQVSLDGLSFFTQNLSSKEIQYASYDFSKKVDVSGLVPEIQSFFEQQPLLQHKFKQVDVVYVNELFTLVPKALLDKNNLTDYLKFNTKILSTDFVVYDELDTHDLVNVYIPYANLNNYFFDVFGTFTYHHAISQLIGANPNFNEQSEDTTVLVNMHKTSFELIVFDKKKPLTYALPIVPPPTFEVRVVTTTFSIS